MSYNSVFGGTTIFPADVSYLAVALTENIELEWPLESNSPTYPAAGIIDVTSTGAYSVTLPDATLTSVGQTILFNNLSASTNDVTLKDNSGATIATIGVGTQWQVYLAGVATAAGTWRVLQYGASTASVQASDLAGFGLTVTNATLSQSVPVTTFSSTGLTLTTSNRAGLFAWTGTGAGTLNLPTAATVGSNYFVLVRNSGGGDLTVEPAGSETIDGQTNILLNPGDSATVVTDGSDWYTVGLGRDAVFAFDYTVIAVSGGTYTLSGSELNRIAYKFTGALTADVTIVVPATVQQYWINNATTGSFTLYIKTASGPTTTIGAGGKGIYYCDGVSLILASDPLSIATPIPVADGGTGATSASDARLALGISAFADAIVTATTGSSVRSTIGAAASGANSDITSLSALSTALSVPQGGTGATTASGARTSLGLGTMAVQDASSVTVTGGTITGITDLAVADGGTGSGTASGARTNLGAAASGSNSDISALTYASGVIVGAPTGGAQGVGTLNTTGLYINGVGVGTGSGSVTSVAATVPAFLSISGSPITTSGTLAISYSGTALPVLNGGTGGTSASAARTNLGAAASGANTDITSLSPTGGLQVGAPTGGAQGSGSINAQAIYINGAAVGSGSGTVTSVAASVPAFLSVSGSPVTTSGTLAISYSGTALPVANGGTGVTTSTGSGNAVLSAGPTFTGTAAFASTTASGTIGSADGTALAPAITFTSDTNTGLYRVGPDNIGIAAGGVLSLDVSTTAVTSALPVVGPLGAAATPTYTFTGDTNTGIYSSGADTIDLATGGAARVSLGTTALTSTLPVIAPLGAAATPSYTFSGDTNTGVFSSGADVLNLSAGGTSRVAVSTTAVTSSVPFVMPLGSVSAPGLTLSGDTNTGLYSGAADDLRVTCGGTQIAAFTATTFATAGPMYTTAGSAATPAFSFILDTNTGLYNIGADNIGVSTGGTLRFDVSTTAVTSTLPVVLPTGAAATPSLTFTGDTDTGLYRPSANSLCVASGGALCATFTGQTLTVEAAVYVNGSAASPAYSFTSAQDTGMYYISSNKIGFSTSGTLRVTMSGTAVTLASGVALVLPSTTPASASATGVAGTITWDSSYIYVCTATDTWRRVAIATW
jgi:hypothetical protein